jgi:hypothetical protein
MTVVSSILDDVLVFLSFDGDAHTLDEIATALDLSLAVCERIAHFLVRFDFAYMEEKGLKIEERTRDFVLATADRSILRVMPST